MSRPYVDPAVRITSAADEVLAERGYVGMVDALMAVRVLDPAHLRAWHSGRMQYLDEMLQGSPAKFEQSVRAFRQWGEQRGLRREDLPPHDASASFAPKSQTASQIPELDKLFRLHFVSPEMPEKKLEKLREKVGTPPPPTVFSIVRESKCSQCKKELWRGEMLTMRGQEPWCLECADLDHLVFLGSGDTCVTRRATKYSSLWAVVVRFSRTRKRYERQGVLVQPEALEKAEEECLADADLRAAQQARAAERREAEDSELAVQMAEKIRELFPGVPAQEASRIAAHTAERGSGRVGRSAAGRALDDEALRLAVGAWVRHHHTNYDDLLMRGVERDDARSRVRDKMEEVLERWRP